MCVYICNIYIYVKAEILSQDSVKLYVWINIYKEEEEIKTVSVEMISSSRTHRSLGF